MVLVQGIVKQEYIMAIITLHGVELTSVQHFTIWDHQTLLPVVICLQTTLAPDTIVFMTTQGLREESYHRHL